MQGLGTQQQREETRRQVYPDDLRRIRVRKQGLSPLGSQVPPDRHLLGRPVQRRGISRIATS